MYLIIVLESERNHMNDIGEIFITLDSHHKRHIAHAAFWSDIPNDVEGIGKSPGPFTEVSHEDIKNGKWHPRDCSLKVFF